MSHKALVIDDEEDFRLIAEDILKSSGFEVFSSKDGAEGLVSAKKFKPDIILLDWKMPKMDGETFCRKLREDSSLKKTPIIMLTVNSKPEAELEALHFGVDDFIAKPYKKEEFLARVRAVLRQSRSV